MLVVEDDRRMAHVLRQALEEDGHAVSVAFDGGAGLELAMNDPFDLLILDVMLPVVDGFTIARRLRLARVKIPILILTARDTNSDVVRGLDLGADDYLTKPFSLEILLARVRAVSRRGPITQPVCLQIADLTLEPATREVRRGGRPVNLTRTEYAILELLMRGSGRVVTRQALIDSIWGDEQIESNTLDAFVSLLRSKITLAGEAKLIHTIRGVGYCVREDQ